MKQAVSCFVPYANEEWTKLTVKELQQNRHAVIHQTYAAHENCLPWFLHIRMQPFERNGAIYLIRDAKLFHCPEYNLFFDFSFIMIQTSTN